MKLIFLVLTLIFIDSKINALSCVDPDQSIEISDDFTLTAIQDKLDQLEADTESDECQVQIIFDYYEQSIEIHFGFGLYSPNANREVFVGTIIQLAKDITDFNQVHVSQLVEFLCDDADGCDLRFVRDQLKWLFNVNYNELISAIRPLIMIEEENTDQFCVDYYQRKQQNCSNGLCYFKHSRIENSIQGGCFQTKNIWTKLSLDSLIIADENIYKEEEKNEESPSIPQIAILDRSIQYECEGNKCNNQTIAKLVIKAVKDHYSLSEAYEVLNVKIEENSEENSESTAISTEISTTSTIPHSTTISSQVDTTSPILYSTTISTKISTTSPVPRSTTTKKPDTTTVKTPTTTTKTDSTTVSIITTTEQQSSVATSLHTSIIMTIINSLLLFYF